MQNRLTSTIDNLASTATNLKAAESAIRDTDMPVEMATFTKYQVLTQVCTAMLAQANQGPQTIPETLNTL